MKHKDMQIHHHWMGLLFGLCILLTAPTYGKRTVEQFNLPQPQSYANYELRVEASERRPEVGKLVVFKAIINPPLADDNIEYHFLINGAPIAEPGMHKVYTFEETGTYKISAVAKLGGSYLLNSPPIILHVIDAWDEPEAVISPQTLTVQIGQDAVFDSLSQTDPQSRQWLYWSISSGHRGSGEKFLIKTDKLEPGKYPIELRVKDDRNRESVAHAFLILTEEEVETLTMQENDQEQPLANNQLPPDIELRSSHSNRLQDMQVVFWIQNAQPGADTELQLDAGDGTITPWSKKLRYGHRYEHFGIYTARIHARTPDQNIQSNAVTVFVWPLWLPVIMVSTGILLAGIPFFKRHQRRRRRPDPISYLLHPDPGFHQLILSSEEETPALVMSRSMHGSSTVSTEWKEKNENNNQPSESV